MEEAVEDRRAIGIAENVIRRVVRAFYEPEAVVVLEGLLRLGDKNSVRGEEIAQQLQLPHKLVRRMLAHLSTDNLVRSMERKETHGNREVSQQYWRVDHKVALDSIKLRLRRMQNAMKAAPVELQTSYECKKCEGVCTQMLRPALLVVESDHIMTAAMARRRR
jgi:transcription initiation factor IIE alpha subunit